MKKALKKNTCYIWQQNDWPSFTWNSETLLPALSQARKIQGQLMAQASSLGLESQAQIVTEEAMTTSAIEGEKLDHNSVRSSVARRLGLPTAGLSVQQRAVEGLVDMLLDATQNWNQELTARRLQGWQSSLFPSGYSGIHEIAVGKWRQGAEPMRVISGRMGKEVIHYEAPPSLMVSNEMTTFLLWWKHSARKMDGLLRAGVSSRVNSTVFALQ